MIVADPKSKEAKARSLCFLQIKLNSSSHSLAFPSSSCHCRGLGSVKVLYVLQCVENVVTVSGLGVI